MVSVLRALLFLGLLLGTAARAQQPWTNVDSPTTRTLWGIVHGGPLGDPGQFVAVGEAGTIVTSPDGVSWTARNSGTDKWLLGITWSPTVRVFVAVGDAGTILTSSDGITWSPRNSGTTQRLNSVGWAPKRFTYPDVFLAVGENGTALISYDLETWRPRATGVSGWLRGIASSRSGPDRFIVTGHDGTILLTEDAGETWSRPASGTTLHLDAVASRGNAGFYATGTNFVLTRTNDSGRTWTLDRTVNTDGRENGIVYNGLVWFNEALIAVGDQGRIIDEAGRRWATTEPQFAGWRAVAASSSLVVAVGTDGSIATAPRDPNLSLEYDITPSFLADTIILTATQRRRISGQRATVQWSLNGTPIPGAGGLELRLSTLFGARDGTYTFTTTADDGSSFSTSITLAPQPNPPALGLVDLAFRPELAAPPGPIVPLPDGRLYVSARDPAAVISGRRSNGLVRLMSDGSLDPTFAVSEGVLVESPQAVRVQPDGRVVVVERVTGITTTHRITRLNPNGSIDSTWRPDPLLVGSGEMPILLSDGRWLAVERRLVSTASANFTAVLRRFTFDGAIDPAVAAVELMTGTTDVYGQGRVAFFDGPRVVHTRDTQGRIHLGVHHGDFLAIGAGGQGGTSRLFRLRPDGLPDPEFRAQDVGPLYTLVATPQGLFARTSLKTWTRPNPTRYETVLFRLKFDGTHDPSFESRNLHTAIYTAGPRPRLGLGHDFDVLAVLPDGSLLTRAVGHLGHFGIVRFDASGKLDRNFNAELGSDAVAVEQVHALPNGPILVAGTFRSLLGVVQPYLARLTPNVRAATTYLSNVSVRARTGGAAGPLIAGFVTHGGETSVLARAAGPALAQFDVPAPLADPRLGLFSGPAEILSNDNWATSGGAMLAAAATRLGAFPFAAGSADSALLTTVPAGPFTVHVAGGGEADGIALAELYHAGARPADASAPRVVNFSVRTNAGTDADTVIAGFTLHGDNTRNVVIRAVGPALARFGIAGYLPDPVLTLFRGETPIAANDDWAVSTDTWTTLSEAFTTVGAFPLQASGMAPTSADKDAALLISLAPGSYTIQVTGKAGASGTALVEIYEVP